MPTLISSSSVYLSLQLTNTFFGGTLISFVVTLPGHQLFCDRLCVVLRTVSTHVNHCSVGEDLVVDVWRKRMLKNGCKTSNFC